MSFRFIRFKVKATTTTTSTATTTKKQQQQCFIYSKALDKREMFGDQTLYRLITLIGIV